jgi:hypothetical protein
MSTSKTRSHSSGEISAIDYKADRKPIRVIDETNQVIHEICYTKFKKLNLPFGLTPVLHENTTLCFIVIYKDFRSKRPIQIKYKTSQIF